MPSLSSRTILACLAIAVASTAPVAIATDALHHLYTADPYGPDGQERIHIYNVRIGGAFMSLHKLDATGNDLPTEWYRFDTATGSYNLFTNPLSDSGSWGYDELQVEQVTNNYFYYTGVQYDEFDDVVAIHQLRRTADDVTNGLAPTVIRSYSGEQGLPQGEQLPDGYRVGEGPEVPRTKGIAWPPIENPANPSEFIMRNFTVGSNVLSPTDRGRLGFYRRTDDGPIDAVLNDTQVFGDNLRMSPVTSGYGGNGVAWLGDRVVLQVEAVDASAPDWLPVPSVDRTIVVDSTGAYQGYDLATVANPQDPAPFDSNWYALPMYDPFQTGRLLTHNDELIFRAVYQDSQDQQHSGLYTTSDFATSNLLLDLDALVDPINGEQITSSNGNPIFNPERFNIDEQGRMTFVGWTVTDGTAYYAVVDNEIYRMATQGEMVGTTQIRDSSHGSYPAFGRLNSYPFEHNTQETIGDWFIFNAHIEGDDHWENALFVFDLSTLGATVDGDFDGDGDVDDFDLNVLLSNWNLSVGTNMGDLDGSGIVDDFDLNILLSNWTGELSEAAAAIETIPEPMSLALLGAGGLVILRRRNR